jgi:hypothetical protein
MPELRDNSDARVRDHLIGEFCDLRQMLVNTARGGNDDELERAILAHYNPTVDALLDGKAVRFARYFLPASHPLRPPHGGHPSDDLVIGEDNVVRLAPR